MGGPNPEDTIVLTMRRGDAMELVTLLNSLARTIDKKTLPRAIEEGDLSKVLILAGKQQRFIDLSIILVQEADPEGWKRYMEQEKERDV